MSRNHHSDLDRLLVIWGARPYVTLYFDGKAIFDVLLSRSYNTTRVASIKFDSSQSDDEIFGILLACRG